MDVLLAFIIGRIILSATPGPGVLTSIIKAISDGFNESMYFLSGVVLCNIIYLLLALYGISSLSRTIGEMFFLVKIFGGFYLIIIGIKLFQTKNFQNRPVIHENKNGNFVSGFILTAGNPEPILFYASVLPTLIEVETVNTIEVFIMIIIIVSVSFLITGSYCYLASHSKSLLINKNLGKYINKMAGIIMSITGSYLIIK